MNESSSNWPWPTFNNNVVFRSSPLVYIIIISFFGQMLQSIPYSSWKILQKMYSWKLSRLFQCQIHLLLGKLSVVPSGASCASCAKWCHNWIVEKKLGSSESTIASAFNSWEELTLLCRLTRQGCFPTVSLSLCVCLDILRSSPRIVALIELYRWRHIPPPWMDWFFVGVAIDIFWPQIQGQSAGAERDDISRRHKGGVIRGCAGNATDRRITTRIQDMPSHENSFLGKTESCLCETLCPLAEAQREMLCLNSILHKRTHSRGEGAQFYNLVQSS